MLNGLDDINWSSLRDAYGAATETPDRIQALISSDPAAAARALDKLNFSIVHQGAVFESGEAAVPFLAEALELATPEVLPGILGLLAALSRGQGYYDRAQHLPILGGPIRDSLPDADVEIEAERDLARDTARAVFAEWDRAERLLKHPEATVRAAALYLLVLLGQNDLGAVAGPDDPRPYLGVRPLGTQRGLWAARAARAAESALDRDIGDTERASALSAFLPLGRADHPEIALEKAEGASLLIHYVLVEAAVARAGGFGAPAPDELAPHIARLVSAHDEIQKAMGAPDFRWRCSARAQIIQFATGLSDSAIDRIIDVLDAMLRPGEWQNYCLGSILRLILGSPPPRIPEDPCRLSRGRRRLATAILEAPESLKRPNEWVLHPDNWSSQQRLAKLGLSGDAETWRSWLDSAA